MCLQLTQFCSGSTKPLLFAGGFLTLLLAVAIGYTGCTTNALYNDIEPRVASAHSISYFLQLAAAGYLTLIAIFSCYAAHYDQKHSIRALSILAVLNLILAIVAILMMPPHQSLGEQFIDTLKQASEKYDRTDKGPPQLVQATTLPPTTSQIERQEVPAMNLTIKPQPRRRYADESESAKETTVKARDLTKEEATRIWDRLQARGCCGINNGTDWKPTIPKSCCAKPKDEGPERICRETDLDHQQGCVALIDSTGLNLLIVLALIALVNFYLAIISGISAYRTFHYNEASQSAYT